MGHIVGSFQLTSSENFDEYLETICVGIAYRDLVKTAKPVIIEITEHNGKWNLKTTVSPGFHPTEISFTLGQDFDETIMDGRQCWSIITRDGDNKLIHVQRSEDFEAKIVREFTEDNMKATFYSKNVSATRIYTRL